RLDSILVREILVSDDIRERFTGYGQQTMDNPRLHYLAGKLFFLDSLVPFDSLLNADTACYQEGYLLTIKYKASGESNLGNAAIGAMIKEDAASLPPQITNALKLRAWIRDNSTPLLSPKEREAMRVDLISLIMDQTVQRDAGLRTGSGAEGYRERLSTLISQTGKTRNWISAYPLDGLMASLDDCVSQGKDTYEKNWCRLQQAAFLIRERGSLEQVNELMSGLIKDDQGVVLLTKGDEQLLRVVTAILKAR
ncbi:MAG: hypothetical protein U1C55_10130, partial [Smithellaceae bacterium]|nr:hypothetical protein [Smithellaceae bacterium]